MCLVLFGARGMESEIGSGQFYCPKCQKERPYRNISVRRWFTLFLLPVIPLNELGSYIACPFCQTNYTGEVLNAVPPAERQKAVRAMVNEAVKRLLVGIACADGQVDPKEAEYAVELGRRVLGDSYNHEWFAQDVERFRGDDLIAPIRTVGGMVDEEGKELLLKLAVLLAASDGEIAAAESKLINRIAEALEVPELRVPVITQHALQHGMEAQQEPVSS